MKKGCGAIKVTGASQLRKILFANILVFIGFFSFYYLFVFHILPDVGVTNATAIMQAIFIVILVLTLVLVSHVKPNLGKKHIVLFSLCIMLALPFLIFLKGLTYVLIPVIFISIFLGAGQLAFYKVFWNNTNTNNIKRARIAGYVGFGAVLLYFITSILSSTFDFFGNIALSFILISTSAIGGLLINEPTNYTSTKKAVYYPERRTIILYTFPWVVFSFLNVTLTKNITIATSGLSSSTTYLLLFAPQIIGGLFGALIGGYLADKIGRRITLVFSVALYGVSMAFRGFTDNVATLLFSFMGEGLTWGIFLTLYNFVIWGDLSNTNTVEKTYTIGLTIFYATAGLSLLNLFTLVPIVESTLISCIMIFLTILPIVLAPELLTSEAQEKNKLRKYIETVRKVANVSE